MRSGLGIFSSHVAWDYCAFIVSCTYNVEPSFIDFLCEHRSLIDHLYRPFHGTHDGKLCFSMLLPAPGSSTILYPSQWKVAGRLAFKINCIHVLLSLLCFSTFSSGMSLTACITVSPHIHGMRYGVRACMVLMWVKLTIFEPFVREDSNRFPSFAVRGRFLQLSVSLTTEYRAEQDREQ